MTCTCRTAAGDVLRIAAPAIAVIAALVLVGRFAPEYLWLLIVLLVGGGYVCFSKLPQKDLAAIAEREQEPESKIGSIPVIGPIAKPALRLLNWLAVVAGAIVLVLLVLASTKSLF